MLHRQQLPMLLDFGLKLFADNFLMKFDLLFIYT